MSDIILPIDDHWEFLNYLGKLFYQKTTMESA
jgi:hypothetical protein